jgi:hypothetical protein
MYKWLKGMIAAECVVLIVGVAYKGWSEWSAYETWQTSERSAAIDAAATLEYQKKYATCAEIVYNVMVKLAYQHAKETSLTADVAKSDQCLIEMPGLANDRNLIGEVAASWLRKRVEKLKTANAQ